MISEELKTYLSSEDYRSRLIYTYNAMTLTNAPDFDDATMLKLVSSMGDVVFVPYMRTKLAVQNKTIEDYTLLSTMMVESVVNGNEVLYVFKDHEKECASSIKEDGFVQYKCFN